MMDARGLTTQSIDHIAEVPAAEWNALADHDHFYQSHEWLSLIERDNTAEARYVLVRNSDGIVGALALYEVAHEANASYRLERLEASLGIRAGHLLAGGRRGYHSDLLICDQFAPELADRVADALITEALDVAAGLGHAGLGMFCLPTDAVRRLARVRAVTASFDTAESIVQPTGGGIEGYLADRTSKQRAKIRREMRAFDDTGWSVRAAPMTECLDVVSRLASNVERRYGHETPDVLLKRLLRREATHVGGQELTLICEDLDGVPVACTVNYCWRDTMYSRVVGLDYERLGRSFAYFNVLLYRCIEAAAERGLNRLSLGQATAPKVERGAELRPLWMVSISVDAGSARRTGLQLTDAAALSRWSEPFADYREAMAEFDLRLLK